MTSREAVLAIDDGGINSGLVPEYFYDLQERKLVILGGLALDKVVTVHPYVQILIERGRTLEEDSGKAASALPSLKSLITVEGLIPKEFKHRNNIYGDLEPEDHIKYGHWLMDVVAPTDKALTANIINNAALLGLGASAAMLADPTRFGKITTYQRTIDQEKQLIARLTYEDWDDWDFATFLREVGEEEGRMPSIQILRRRVKEGKRGPSDMIIRNKIPLPVAYEKAGFLFPRGWDLKKHSEWGSIFISANGRVPTHQELVDLSAAGKGPSGSGVQDVFGSISAYQRFIQKTFDQRALIKIAEINRGIAKNNLPTGILVDVHSQDELTRRVGRYKIIKSLFPQFSQKDSLQFSLYDVTNSAFVDYLNTRGRVVPDWVAESVAWGNHCVPDLFPHGTLYKSLRMEAA